MKGPRFHTNFPFQFSCPHNHRQVNCMSIRELGGYTELSHHRRQAVLKPRHPAPLLFRGQARLGVGFCKKPTSRSQGCAHVQTAACPSLSPPSQFSPDKTNQGPLSGNIHPRHGASPSSSSTTRDLSSSLIPSHGERAPQLAWTPAQSLERGGLTSRMDR